MRLTLALLAAVATSFAPGTAQQSAAKKVSAQTLERQWIEMRKKGYSMLRARVVRPDDERLHGTATERPWSTKPPFLQLLGEKKKYPAGHWVWRAPAWYLWERHIQTRTIGSPIFPGTWGGSSFGLTSTDMSEIEGPPSPVPAKVGEPSNRAPVAFRPFTPPDPKGPKVRWFGPHDSGNAVWVEFGDVVAPRAVRIVMAAPSSRIREIHARGLDGRWSTVFRRSKKVVSPADWRLPLVHVPRTTGLRIVLDRGARVLGIDAIGLVDRKGKEHWARSVRGRDVPRVIG